MSTTQLICLGVNALVLVYYGRKYFKIRSFYNKTEKATSVLTIDSETLSSLIGQYVIVSGKVKALAETIPSQYTSVFKGVVHQIQKVTHSIIRIAGFWLRKSQSTSITTEKATLFALVENVPTEGNAVHVIIQNPLQAIRQTSSADLFTGYRGVSWPLSNIIHDRFIVNDESTNPFKIMLCGAHEMGVQETESLILDGSYITAVGHLRPSHDGNFRIAAEMLTLCDKNMLLKKIGDVRAGLVWKLMVFGTIAGILCLFILKKKVRDARNDREIKKMLKDFSSKKT